MKRQIPESFKEHIKHPKGEMPMDKPMGEPKMPAAPKEERIGRAHKQYQHGHGRKPSPRGLA